MLRSVSQDTACCNPAADILTQCSLRIYHQGAAVFPSPRGLLATAPAGGPFPPALLPAFKLPAATKCYHMFEKPYHL